ncbi:endonuclease [Xinfangfangia sp. CPCC 101601]|uniref:Endonuclease n=1 Tax=Pseudogemmobacter lacusdianii TaxID=3069608 RepID=A0ABU0VTA2_9RHOB|nr:endonuclease/exonuclease/phosphatase family protein [Xinfangfangia sp. CPCC 101601]MDQ2064938.1 endonuclease [Xinfangfangia sp. CPCC 101601]
MALRLASFNVEWFNGLFDDAGQLLADTQPSARYGISRAQQIAALGLIFRAMDADAVMVIEAPDTNSRRSTITALEHFAAHFGLRARRALHGFSSDTEQEIALLYDPDVITAKHDPISKPVPRFDSSYRAVLDPTRPKTSIQFSKPPLEVALTAHGRKLRLIGVHAKSKAPHGATTPEAVMRLSIENRRKQIAQCLWLRARVEAHLAQGDSLIVLGDLNDGPGLDEYEKLFGKSGVEIVLGCDAAPALRLRDPHAELALQSKVGITPTTARFYLKPANRYFEALLDFIMVSPDLAATQPIWRIWHPFNDPAILAQPDLQQALLQASDHFPVTIDLP